MGTGKGSGNSKSQRAVVFERRKGNAMAGEEERGISAVGDGSETEDEVIFGPGTDGMGRITAMEKIDRRLRKELITNYDLVELVNKGRYYTAKAHSKDGRWLNELLIDKQSGNIQILSRVKEK